MSTIKEDDRIRELFYDIQWHHVQLNDVKIEDKGNFFRIEKESKLLSVDKRKKYKEAMDKAENELYRLLDKVDRIEIRESFEGLEYAEELRNIMKYYSDPNDIEGEYKNEILEYLCDEDIINQDAFFYNYFRLYPPYVKTGTIIPEGIKTICNESRLCYVFRQYNATIVLSRTVVESIIKEECSKCCIKKGNLNELLLKAKNKRIINDTVYILANKIRMLGNDVVHRKKIVTEKDARKTLTDILFLIEEVYL